jgi:L-iditol 2-dehydrogenase
VAFECAGADETPRQCAAICEPGGTVVVVGIPCDDRTHFVNAPVRNKGLNIKVQQRARRAMRRALALARHGRIDLGALVTHRAPLAEVERAFARAEQRSDGTMKTIIEPHPPA